MPAPSRSNSSCRNSSRVTLLRSPGRSARKILLIVFERGHKAHGYVQTADVSFWATGPLRRGCPSIAAPRLLNGFGPQFQWVGKGIEVPVWVKYRVVVERLVATDCAVAPKTTN